MATRLPFMNAGSYKWIPDDFGSTTEQDFGVTRAFYAAVIDYGRPHNVLPEGTGGYASGTSIWGNRVRISKDGTPVPGTITDATNPLPIPFYRSLMRSLSTKLETLPDPGEDEGIGLSSLDFINNSADPPIILFTVDGIGNGRTASILIDYALLTSTQYEEAVGTASPISVVALYDPNTVGDWYDLSRSAGGTTYWGPASAEQKVTGPAIDKARSLLGMPGLEGIHLPLPFRDSSIPPPDNATSIPEFVVTHSGEYSNSDPSQPWGVKATRTVSIRTCRRYLTASDYFPKLKAILIMPNDQATVVGTPGNQRSVFPSLQPHWNFMVSRIRFYDAIQANVVPEHTEQDGNTTMVIDPQFPCQIFGYAWRISHPVQMSRYTPVIQPAIGTTLGSDPGNARRTGTFKFKLYHPDVDGIGIAHSVRFYYGLAVMAMPGTSPFASTFSLAGLLGSMTLDQDLLLVQYMGPLPGHQSLTFIPSTVQMHEDRVGRVAYAGIFGYSRQTVALKAYSATSYSSTPPRVPSQATIGLWRDVGQSKFPASDRNGVRPLWYDPYGTRWNWYTFLSLDASGVTSWNPNVPASYAGGFTTADRGGPQTHLPGIGAMNMTTSTSSSFGGIERTTVYAKVKSVVAGTLLNVQAWNDMDSHLATFVSDVRTIGSSAQIFTGNWRVQFAAWIDDASRHDVQVFYRFAFVNGNPVTGVPDDMLNGTNLWTYGPDMVQEFHFEPSSGGMKIKSGPPPAGGAMSTPPITTQPITYDLTWFCEGATPAGTDPVFNSNMLTDVLERNITATLGFGDVRVVIQAWAVAYAVPGAPLGDRDADTWYPTVAFSWGGDVEAVFQTMITETKSGAIFAQQDPIVASYGFISKNEIVAADLGDYSGQKSIGAPRDRPLYDNILSLSGGQQFIAGAEEQNPALEADSVVLSTAGAKTPGGISLTGIVPREYYDALEDYAQVVDRYVSIDSGTDAVLGGTAIKGQTVSVTGTMWSNRCTFDARVVFSLWLVNGEETVAYMLARSGPTPLFTGNKAAADQSDPVTISTTMDIGQDVVVPDSTATLMLRIQVWAYRNINDDAIIQIPATATGFDPGFMSIDIADLKMTFGVGLECISNESYLLGSNNWYQNLPVSSARTFGSSDYYFVADYDSVKQTIMPPQTTSMYGTWYLWGWMFSPFWFVDMPEGGVFEIQDRAGLTLGNAVTGTNFVGAERAQRVVRVRTAIDTVPSSGVSATRGSRNFGETGFISRSAIENTGDPTGGNALGVIPMQSNDMLKGLMEWIVRAGDTIVTGKNPLIVAIDPSAEWVRHLGLIYSRAQPQVRLLFYEEDTFDSAAHQSSIAMLANYDGTGKNWRNPYGSSGSGGTNRVVMTNDMEMLGACVDPHTHSIYVVGFRSTDLESPQEGGSIVMRELQPLLVFGSDSAATGPLHYVDGTMTEESWITSGMLQPLIPNATSVNGPQASAADIMRYRGNHWGANGDTLPAASGFADCFCDYMGNVYVFYSLLADMSIEGPMNPAGALGKVFCRRTHNCGYYFDQPFPVADLGYAAACSRVGVSAIDDDSFQVRHITVIYDDQHSLYIVFFWAGGKIFMKYGADPAVAAQRAGSINQGAFYGTGSRGDDQIYMVAGSTDFIEHSPSTALDRWLRWQWGLAGGSETPDPNTTPPEYAGWFADDYDAWGVTEDKANNYGVATVAAAGQPAPVQPGTSPFILINRFDNDPDVPPQRVAAFVTTKEEVVIVFMDGLYQLMYKRIRMSGRQPVITPAVHLATNVS